MKTLFLVSAMGAALLAPLATPSAAKAQGVEFRLGPGGFTVDSDRDRRAHRREMERRRAYEEGRRDERRRQRWDDRGPRRWSDD